MISCRVCGEELTDPLGVVGDLCDICIEMDLEIARMQEEWRKEEALNLKLKERPQ